ncbi:hypothetical protein CVT25_004899 [Psilocybe cyanescens]|uniref:Uncharacterized protein n=1 Tax=Psilocybe cyanescens TaxID=93625 RepID=A0A409XBH5_PSICY|nr:hypothetical protein CVT25_004899 [Psilocybe cyanescens]
MYFDIDDSYEQWSSSSDVNFVSPQNLINVTNTPQQLNRRDAPTKVHSTSPSSAAAIPLTLVDVSGSDMSQVCLLEPGKRHLLSQAHDPIPTAHTIMNGEYEAALRAIREAADVVAIVPRLPQHTGLLSIPSIAFSVCGRPGVYLHELGAVQLDNASDPVFEGMGWKRTRVEIDWPGIQRIGRNNNLPCLPNQGFYTRQEVASEIGKRVREVLLPGTTSSNNYARQELNRNTRRWDIRSIDYYAVRVIGINYYFNWVPVLAIDDK